jgi:hypothetical protein
MTAPLLVEVAQTTLIALAGVAVAAVAVKAFGQERPIDITAEAVIAELEHAFPAFRPAAILRDHPDGRAALALDQKMTQLATVFTFGTVLTSRCIPVSDAVLEVAPERVTVRLADLVTPDVAVRLPPQLPHEFATLFARSQAAP